MLTKPAIAALSMFAVLTYACVAQAARARQSASTMTGNNPSQLEQCHLQDAGSLSSGSDFVAVPYTFGTKFSYRRAWIGDKKMCNDNSQKTTRDWFALPSAPVC